GGDRHRRSDRAARRVRRARRCAIDVWRRERRVGGDRDLARRAARRGARHRDAVRCLVRAAWRGRWRHRAALLVVKFAAALLALCAVAHAETLRGTVVEKASQKPVGGATITIAGELAASADDGTFTITLPRGRYTLEVSADWLESVKVPVVLDRDRELRIEVTEKAAPTGETIEVIDIAPSAV